MIPKKRTNDQIFSEILKICMDGATKTRIVYQANLNFRTAKPYLDKLMKNGFIEAVRDGSRVIYKTTPQGLDLKGRFEQFHGELDKLYACV